MTERILIQNGRVIDPSQGIDEVRTVVIEDGRIVGLPKESPEPSGCTVVDAQGLWVLPGLVDLHVHLREPGEEHKETIETGARAAVAGGFTSIVAMPNTRPVNDTVAVTELMLERARRAGLARVYPSGAVSVGQKGVELAELGDLADAGCVAFTDDGHPVMNAALMRRALEYARGLDRVVMVHEQDLHLSGKGSMHEGAVSTRLGLPGIPAAAEDVMVARDIELAELTGGRLHVGHLSTGGSARLVRDAKARGLPVTCEVTPHHFTLTDEVVDGYDTRTKMMPPLRAMEDRGALVEALRDGTVDAIATDHAPHSPVDKDVEYDRAANGVVGLETALALTLRLVHEGELPLERAVTLLTCGPARVMDLPAGTLAEGAAADVILVDPDREWEVRPERFFSKGRNTPFAGWRLRGRVTKTFVGGRLVHTLGETD